MHPTRSGPEQLLQWLRSLGYRVAFRREGWVECLLSTGTERWVGRGIDRGEALDDAVGQLLPSHAARTLLLDRFGRTADPAEEATTASPESAAAELEIGDLSPPVAVVVPVPASTEPLDAPQPPVPEPAALPQTPPRGQGPEGQDTPAPAMALGLASVADSLALDPGAESDGAETEESPDASPTPKPPVVLVAVPPPMDPDEALAEVGLLAELIESKEPELGLMTPERQRLAILAWICHARALQASSNAHPRVVTRVTSIARKLTSLSKVWWPGSVMALQIEASPFDVGRELELAARSRPRSWSDAAEASESKLRLVEGRDERGKRDEYGWADGAYLDPAPMNPDGLLTELRNLIEQIAGPIDQIPAKRAPTEVRRPSADDQKRRYGWARRLRWLRGFITEFEVWARVMGRLRWIAAQAEQRDELLDTLLSPAYHPQRSWAAALGQDPDAKRKRRLKKSVLQRRPGGESEPEQDVLVSWLTDAFQVLDANRIAKLLAPYQRQVLELGPADIPGANRYERRRLRSVQKHMSAIGDGLAPDDDELESEDEEVIGTLDEAVDPAAEVARDPAAELLSKVLPRTRGLRALFVSNRTDPELEETLRSTFGFAGLDWCEGSPRRVQTVSERVTRGTYDIVLGATGFQSHSMDTHLIRACRRAEVRYVRVHRGRQLACTLALARELGISS